MVGRLLTVAAAIAVLAGPRVLTQPVPRTDHIQFVFTSDAHYGITRAAFRGNADVAAHVVNAALVAGVNALPSVPFPTDEGLRAAEPVGAIDFLVEGGDVANRAEFADGRQIQSPSASWTEFRADYLEGVQVLSADGRRAPVYVVPGNHEASNAVGFHKPMTPPHDATAIAEEFNLMMRPAAFRSTATYRFASDKVLTSRDVGGVHFVFLTVWPDSLERAWMNEDLRGVDAATPVVIFVHDQPDAEAKHFTNPNGAHDVNAVDQFENLLADTFADGPTTKAASIVEQRALEGFLRAHPNITAYFHGNSNWNQFYDWTGPDHSIALHTFRVDSPMKGAVSSRDEAQLSFQVATIDMATHRMTVRECLWNTAGGARLAWGASTTVALTAH